MSTSAASRAATTLHCDMETMTRLEALQRLHHGAPKSRIVADLVRVALERETERARAEGVPATNA